MRGCDYISRKESPMRNYEEKKQKNKNPFLRELEFYKREGIPLQLNGVPSTPKKIAKAHKIAEDITYMRDYVRDSQGRDRKSVV